MLVIIGAVLLVGPGRLASAQPQTLMPRSILQPPTGDANPGDAFGRAMAIAGDRLVVGAPGDDERGTDAGAAYVYVRTRGGWTLEAKLAPAMLRPGDAFGTSVGIDHERIVVGAPGDDRDLNDAGLQLGFVIDRGAAYVFLRNGTVWTQEVRLQPDALPMDDRNVFIGPGDAFGSAVAVLARRVVVGAPLTDHMTDPWGLATDAGAAYVYDLALSWSRVERWSPVSSLYRFARNARFGAAVIFDTPSNNNYVSIGAPFVGELSPGEVQRYTNFVTPLGASSWQATLRHDSTPYTMSPHSFEGIGFYVYADGRVTSTPQGLRLAGDLALRSLTPGGRIALLAENKGFTGYADGNRPVWLADRLVFRYSPTRVSSIAPDGSETMLAGSDVQDFVDAVGSQARFRFISSAISDGADGLYVADGATLRHVDASGTVETLIGQDGDYAATDGVGHAARLHSPRELFRDAADGSVYFLDGSALRVMRPGRVVITLVGSVSDAGAIDGIGTAARLSPTSFALTPGGGFMIGESRSLRLVSALLDVTTVVATPDPGRIVDGVGASARVQFVKSMAYGQDGLLYLVDAGTVRTLSASFVLKTIAGLPLPGILAPSEFGASLATDGATLLIGGPRIAPPTAAANETSGVAWAFGAPEFENPVPQIFRYPLFPASGRDATMRFGASVAVGGNIALVSSIRAGHAGPPAPVLAFQRDADRVWTHALTLSTTSDAGNDFGAGLGVVGRELLVGSPSSPDLPAGFVALYNLDDADSDGDGMPDGWETQFGLDPALATGVNGGAGDKDGDGITNADEYVAQTHPGADPAFTRYFAEGATTWQFGTWMFLANPGADAAKAQLRFLRSDGTIRTHVIDVPAMSMEYVAVQDLPEMTGVEFSTTIESDQLIVADRAMWWPRDPRVNPYGSHVERAIAAPASTWYFAEGATHSGFDLFYLLQNPNPTDIDVLIRYLRPSAPPLEKLYRVPALSRKTVWVDMETFDTANGPQTLLDNTDVAAVIHGGTPPAPGAIFPVHPPFIVERALYRQGPNDRPFEAGHESAGVTAPAAGWFFAEGATGDMFDTFFLVANPSDTAAQVRATYLLDTGETFTRDLTVGANARTNIWADVETFDGGTTFPLADADFSTTLASTNGIPIVAERSMWWPGPSFTTWHEAHNSFGSTETGTMWVAGFGASFFGSRTQTYVLIANPSDATASITVTPITASGPQVTQTYTIAPHSRFNVAFDPVVAPAGYFGVIVESTGSPATPVVVERAVYAVAGALNWPVGSASLLTKIR